MKKLDLYFRVLVCICLFGMYNASAQTLINRPNVYINANCNGYVEFLPADYANNSQQYPLLIFIHGNSQWGPGTNSSLQSVRDLGPNYYVNQKLNPSTSYIPFPGLNDLGKMVMISPQFIGPDFYSNPPTVAQIDDVVNYACNNYRVDRSRIYCSGVSFGGRWALEYAQAFPYRVAAIVPLAPAVYADQVWANRLAAANLPIWMFNNINDGSVDPQVTQDWISAINNPTAPIPPPTPLAIATYPPVSGHWYDDTYRGMDTATNGQNKNMYRWMMQYSRANHFTGGAGTAWETPANWSYRQVPVDTTEVVIRTGPVFINSNAACKKITVKNGVTLTVISGYKLEVKK